jgi:hypothetical protein
MQLLGVTVLNRQNYPDLPASPPEYGLYCPAYPSEDATKLLPTSLEYKDGVLKWGRWKVRRQRGWLDMDMELPLAFVAACPKLTLTY